MDQIKIGKFIAEMRKEQNLTQIDLAEKLGISNKTISKWECGNGMPDYAVMESLCEVLHINVNELLSGERLPSKEYTRKAEENMMSLMQESSVNYKREKRDFFMMILGITAIVVMFFLMIMTFGGIAAFGNFIDVPQLFYLLCVFILVLVVAGMQKDFVKAFMLAGKKAKEENKLQMKKSIAALKTGIITFNMAGILGFLIGMVSNFKFWEEGEVKSLLIWTSVSSLSLVYGVLFSLILTPIYMRLKNKLIEESSK